MGITGRTLLKQLKQLPSRNNLNSLNSAGAGVSRQTPRLNSLNRNHCLAPVRLSDLLADLLPYEKAAAVVLALVLGAARRRRAAARLRRRAAQRRLRLRLRSRVADGRAGRRQAGAAPHAGLRRAARDQPGEQQDLVAFESAYLGTSG